MSIRVRVALTFMAGLAILVALNALGAWLVRISGVTVPGSVVGMLLLTALVETGVLPPARVRAAAELLIRHLPLLYVPAGVALLAYWSAVRGELVAIALGALGSLVAVLVVVGLIVQRFERAE